MVESFCPLFLFYALVLLIICIKAAFFTHGMGKVDLFFALIVLTFVGGYFAKDAITLLVNTLFNVLVPALLLRYLGADRKPLVIIVSAFALLTIVFYFVVKLFQ